MMGDQRCKSTFAKVFLPILCSSLFTKLFYRQSFLLYGVTIFTTAIQYNIKWWRILMYIAIYCYKLLITLHEWLGFSNLESRLIICSALLKKTKIPMKWCSKSCFLAKLELQKVHSYYPMCLTMNFQWMLSGYL